MSPAELARALAAIFEVCPTRDVLDALASACDISAAGSEPEAARHYQAAAQALGVARDAASAADLVGPVSIEGSLEFLAMGLEQADAV